MGIQRASIFKSFLSPQVPSTTHLPGPHIVRPLGNLVGSCSSPLIVSIEYVRLLRRHNLGICFRGTKPVVGLGIITVISV